MADLSVERYEHGVRYLIKLIDNGDGTYSESSSLTGGATEATLSALNAKIPELVNGTTPVTQGENVPQHAATSTPANKSASLTVITLQASNTDRRGWTCYNDTLTGTLYLHLGGAASTTNFTIALAPGDYYELPSAFLYDGDITGLWDVADGTARVVEYTA